MEYIISFLDTIDCSNIDNIKNIYSLLNVNDNLLTMVYTYIIDNYQNKFDKIDDRYIIDDIKVVNKCLVLGIDYIKTRIEYEYYIISYKIDISFNEYVNNLIIIMSLSYNLGIDYQNLKIYIQEEVINNLLNQQKKGIHMY